MRSPYPYYRFLAYLRSYGVRVYLEAAVLVHVNGQS